MDGLYGKTCSKCCEDFWVVMGEDGTCVGLPVEKQHNNHTDH